MENGKKSRKSWFKLLLIRCTDNFYSKYENLNQDEQDYSR